MVAAFQQEIRVLFRVVFVLPALAIIFFCAWSIATITAYVNVYFHDTVHLLEVGTQFLFFLTPIMYSRRLLDDKDLGWIVDANPLYWMLEMVRFPLLTGLWPPLDLYLLASGFTALLAGLALGVVAWLHKRLIFHL
ncbi:MAG: hypothetical protein KatS3mg106_146 [Gemmataceae bacterium]|nr:MAG: hypothetical protein KatS3mg106_146 [Gemmataceae bacterium]